MEPNQERSLIPRPSHELSASRNRILAGMVEETLVLGREEAVAQTARFRIGDYVWCEPDYRQLLLWAEALKMEPVTVIEKLLAGKGSDAGRIGSRWHQMLSSEEITTKFQGGRMLSLSWNASELPLWDFRCVEGLAIKKLRLYWPSAVLRNNGKPREIILRLPSLQLLECDGGIVSTTPFFKADGSFVSGRPFFDSSGSIRTALPLSGVPNLTEFTCHYIPSELDLSHVPKLTTFSCWGNEATALDLSHVPNLTVLKCGENKLTELDLSHVPNLTMLSCSLNPITKLDLCHVPNLTELDCSQNRREELDLSHVPKLRELFCGMNPLRKLDLSCVPELAKLSCVNNRLAELDLSHVPNLTELDCDGNYLMELNLSHVPLLTTLWCVTNPMTELDVRPLAFLAALSDDGLRKRLFQRPDQHFFKR